MKKNKYIFTLVMAMVMMAMSPTRVKADVVFTYQAYEDLSSWFQSVFGSENVTCSTWISDSKDATVTVKGTVTSIPPNAFEYCNVLYRIKIPEGVKSIGNNAFSGCNVLKDITISSSVTSIGDNAFSDCMAFRKLYYATSSSLKSIGDAAFCGCVNLQRFNFPSSLTSIGSSAFEGCSNSYFTKLNIPSSVTSIGSSAFQGCSSLSSLSIPSSVTSIGDDAFDGTPWYNNKADGLVYAGKVAYKYKGDMPENTSIVLKSDTKIISPFLFASCSNLVSITIPSSVTSIGCAAFGGCSGLTSVICKGTTPPTLDGYVFDDCNALEKIYVPASSIEVYKSSWSDYANKITSPAVFDYTATANLTSKFQSAFGSYNVSCGTWTNATTPVSVAVISTSIGDNAFSSCSALTSITIPSGIESIRDKAFYRCTGLTTITCQGATPPTLGDNAFKDYDDSNSQVVDLSNLQAIYVPASSVDLYKETAKWSDYAALIQPASNSGNVCNTFDVAITKAGEAEAAVSKKSAILITIDKSTTGKPQVTVQSGAETAIRTAFDHSTRYDFALTPVAINPGSDDLIGNIVAKAPRRTAAAPVEPTTNGPALVIGTSAAYTTYPLDAEHTSITLAMAANGNCMVNGTEVQGVTSIYFIDTHTLPQYFTDGVKKCTACNAVCEVQFTYTASSADAATAINNKFNNKFSSIGDVTCDSWTDASTPVAVTIAADVTSIPDFSLQMLSGLTSITIPSSVTSIGSNAFSGCTALTSVTIPSSVTSIGESAFYACSSLATITIPEGVETIGNNAFSSTGISALNIPKSVTSIGTSITSSCASLATITVAEDNPVYRSQDNCVITKSAIGTQGESGYVAANTLVLGCKNSTIPSSVTSIGNYAFYNAGLSTITIPEGVATIGDWAFGNCSALTSITFPSTLQTIGELAFFRTGFTSITIPSSVTNIGREAFSMTVLTTVILEGTSTAAGNDLFIYNNNLQTIYVPASSVESYKAASGWSAYASKIMAMPAVSVTTSAGATTYYDTFAAGLAAATDGSTIKLLEDLTLTAEALRYDKLILINGYTTNGLTIDLNQKKLSLELEDQGAYGDEAIWIGVDNKVTIKNGTLDIDHFKNGFVLFSCSLTLDGVNVDGTELIEEYDQDLFTSPFYVINSTGSDVVLNNCQITTPSYQYAYFNQTLIHNGNSLTLTGTTKMNGDIGLHNCTLKAASTATITGCTMYVDNVSVGTLSIANGTFTAPTDYKWTADGLSTFSLHKLVLGDLNGDGNITIADLTLLIQLMSQGGTITDKEADVNGDNRVTVDDVETLRDKVLGKTAE